MFVDLVTNGVGRFLVAGTFVAQRREFGQVWVHDPSVNHLTLPNPRV